MHRVLDELERHVDSRRARPLRKASGVSGQCLASGRLDQERRQTVEVGRGGGDLRVRGVRPVDVGRGQNPQPVGGEPGIRCRVRSASAPGSANTRPPARRGQRLGERARTATPARALAVATRARVGPAQTWRRRPAIGSEEGPKNAPGGRDCTRRALRLGPAGGQYPPTGVARQYGSHEPGRAGPTAGREKPSADRHITALSRKETRDHEHHSDSVRYPDTYLAADRSSHRIADRDRRCHRRRRALHLRRARRSHERRRLLVL